MPAQPAPTTSTSCVASTCTDASGSAGPVAPSGGGRTGGADGVVDVGEAAGEVVGEHRRELARLLVVAAGIRPGRARVEERLVDVADAERNLRSGRASC